MKISAFIIFFSIVLSVYILLSWFIFTRGHQALEAAPEWRPWYTVIFWFLSLSYLAARFLERWQPSLLSDILTWTGSLWLALFFYFLVALIIIDFIRLVNLAMPFLPRTGDVYYPWLKLTAMLFAIGMVFITVCLGFINARHPVVRQLRLDIPKVAGSMKHLKIAFVSDIHLGTLVGKNHTGRIIRKINSLRSDIIFLAGDVVDEDLEPVIRGNLGQYLELLDAPLGVYAVTGNHEHIGGAEAAVKYLEEHKIKILRDTILLVNGQFYIAGREDRDISRFTEKKRKELNEILEGIDHSKPLILMDHQPFELQKAVDAGVDLQLSGHTHHGQLWPLNYITRAIYELSWGYLKKGCTQFFVSCGAGTWGPPVRTGNRPEILDIHISFSQPPL